tara:strand:+ start:116 stop:1159 length:1044 start_codon:yes stop_codon:yes gene_type:complete
MDDGHQVKVMVGGSSEMEVPARFAEKELDFECVNAMGRSINPLKDLEAMAAIRNAVAKFAPDIVSAHASKGGAIARVACLGMGIPVLYTPHCWSFVEGFPNAKVYEVAERLLAPFARRIIAVCQQEREFGLARRVGNSDQTVFVHNGVTDSDTAQLLKTGDEQSDNPIRLVMVGRFEEQKDQTLLLRAMAELKESNWKLKFVGDGPSREVCMDLAMSLQIEQRVEFVGYSSNVDDELRDCDVFLLISNWEGFPRSILEAMRSGLPVVTSDVGGCNEAVVDGETGRVVKKGDLNGLVDALRELIDDPKLRKRMGKQGRARYEKNFTFQVMYQKYLSLYQAVLEPPQNK